MKHVDNFYSITALSWKPDGSKLCVGNMTGAVDVYDACVKVRAVMGTEACTCATEVWAVSVRVHDTCVQDAWVEVHACVRVWLISYSLIRPRRARGPRLRPAMRR